MCEVNDKHFCDFAILLKFWTHVLRERKRKLFKLQFFQTIQTLSSIRLLHTMHRLPPFYIEQVRIFNKFYCDFAVFPFHVAFFKLRVKHKIALSLYIRKMGNGHGLCPDVCSSISQFFLFASSRKRKLLELNFVKMDFFYYNRLPQFYDKQVKTQYDWSWHDQSIPQCHNLRRSIPQLCLQKC